MAGIVRAFSWLGLRRALGLLLLADLAVVFLWLPRPREKMFVWSYLQPISESGVPGPYLNIVQDGDRVRLMTDREVNTPPCPDCRLPAVCGQVCASPEIIGQGLWMPWFSRYTYRMRAWWKGVGELDSAWVRRELCSVIARGKACGWPADEGYAAMLARGDGVTRQVHPWSLVHDGMFMLLTALMAGSWARSRFLHAPVPGKKVAVQDSVPLLT